MDGHDPAGGAPRTPDRPPLALLATAGAGFLATVAGQIAVGLALGVMRPDAERGPAQILAITSAGALAMFLVVGLLARPFLGHDLRRLFPRPSSRTLVFTVQAALALWLLSILVNLINVALFGPNPQALVETFSGHRGAEAVVLDLLAGTVVAPVAEETLYRGVLFGGLARRLPFAPAAAISAALFAVVHGLGVALPIFTLGVGLAWIYARTGTLWAPIVAHGVVNGISLLVLFAASGALEGAI